jgi:hypothetical protein
MSHTIVTYTVRPRREHENAALVRAVFEELAKTRPPAGRARPTPARSSRDIFGHQTFPRSWLSTSVPRGS